MKYRTMVCMHVGSEGQYDALKAFYGMMLDLKVMPDHVHFSYVEALKYYYGEVYETCLECGMVENRCSCNSWRNDHEDRFDIYDYCDDGDL